MTEPLHRTPEQIALAEERRIKRENREQAAAREKELKGRILPREWVTVQEPVGTNAGQCVRVMTWNLLAQCLIRRELFPTSDCLKASQREEMLHHEILSHKADICCLQEVDRLEKLLPVLEDAGYSCVYASGPRKRHGCLIAFRKDLYTLVDKKVIEYDNQEVREEGSESARRGGSFRTRNIASLVRLQRLGSTSEGIVVATTHLFWHPSYTYERARQAAILLREVTRFRDESPGDSVRWPCLIAGDFNFPPNDPVYSLLAGDPLLPDQGKRIDASRIVHVTIDPSVPVAPDVPAEEDEGLEGGESDLDNVVMNTRPATPEDGLLTDAELVAMFRKFGSPTSIYEDGQRTRPTPPEMGLTFGSRVPIPPTRHGGFEPVWTSYTHYWQSVLDYLFVLLPPGRKCLVTKLAKPHQANVLGKGVPLKGICGSDHISLGADIYFPD